MPTNGMTIDSLNTVSSLTAADEFPVWDSEESGEPTKKITAQNMANSVKSLASLPNTTEMNTAIDQSTADVIRTGDVVNNLTNNDATKVASQKEAYDLNNNKSNKIQKTEKSVTTNNSGIVDLGMDESQTIIVAITCQDCIAIPFIVGSGRNWWAKVIGWSNMAPIASETLSVNIFHIT